MLTDTFHGADNGIPIRYRFDGKLFNQEGCKLKVQTEVLDEFFFADDMEKGIWFMWSYDLKISIKETEAALSNWKVVQGIYHHTVKGQRCKW